MRDKNGISNKGGWGNSELQKDSYIKYLEFHLNKNNVKHLDYVNFVEWKTYTIRKSFAEGAKSWNTK